MATQNDFPNQPGDGREALRLLILSGLLLTAANGRPTSGLGEAHWLRLLAQVTPLQVTPLQGASIVLRVMHGWNNRAIAEYLNSTHSAVSMCLNLGLRKLAESPEAVAFLEAAAAK